MRTTPQHNNAREENVFKAAAAAIAFVELFSLCLHICVRQYTISLKPRKRLQQRRAYKVLLNVPREHTDLFKTTPLKSPGVFLFIMAIVSLTTSALTGLPVITGEKEFMQISHHVCQQFFSAGAELVKMHSELNSFHL